MLLGFLQLVNVKTRDRKMTLMHVLIEMVAQSTNDDLLELQPCSLDELEEAQLGTCFSFTQHNITPPLIMCTFASR